MHRFTTRIAPLLVSAFTFAATALPAAADPPEALDTFGQCVRDAVHRLQGDPGDPNTPDGEGWGLQAVEECRGVGHPTGASGREDEDEDTDQERHGRAARLCDELNAEDLNERQQRLVDRLCATADEQGEDTDRGHGHGHEQGQGQQDNRQGQNPGQGHSQDKGQKHGSSNQTGQGQHKGQGHGPNKNH